MMAGAQGGAAVGARFPHDDPFIETALASGLGQRAAAAATASTSTRA